MTLQGTSNERDSEVGLDYFGARYFSGAQGRFTSPDWSATPQPIPYADLTDPQTLNLYSYVRNNPLSKTDPDGHQDPTIVWQELQQVTQAAMPYLSAATGAVGGLWLATRDSVQQTASRLIVGLGAAGGQPQYGDFSFQMKFSKLQEGNGSLPANPDALKDDGYHETSHPEAAAAGHRTFENPQSGDKVRFDQAKPGAPGHEGTDHYHRDNPNATGKRDQYLDANGKPVPRGSDASHLKPQPSPPPARPKTDQEK